MRITILKGLISIYGAMVPGKEITVPDHIALNWIKNGIAECEGDAEAKAEAERRAKAEPAPEPEVETPPEPEAKPKKRPAVIPDGMFWCGHCKLLHRVASKIGRRHLGYSQ